MTVPDQRIAVVGSGPAGLMAASVAAKAGFPVTVFEKKKGPAKKLLLAGASGLNVTHDAPLDKLCSFYRGDADFIRATLAAFPPREWLDFMASLGVGTFLGTSRRYFTEGLKASGLLRQWLKSLKRSGVTVRYGTEIADFAALPAGRVELRCKDGGREEFAAACFCLGGGSHEPDEKPLRWTAVFSDKGIKFTPFTASNAGFETDWPEAFLREAEGLPLKNVFLRTPRGQTQGDLSVTRYGLEGAPVYAVGATGAVSLDLKPDLSVDEILKKLSASRENLSPLRRAKKYLKLPPAALALLHHLTPPEIKADLRTFAGRVKDFPLVLKKQRPLDEAISSAGGLALAELDGDLMLKKFPGVFVAGEMLDWDAPTGGFLIQACVSQGFVAGRGAARFIRQNGR